MRLLESLRRAVQPSAENRDAWAATTQKLREMIPACPACKSTLDGHAHSTLAEAGNKHDIDRLFEALRSKDWRDLVSIHSFEGAKNAVIATAIQCPKGPGSVLPYVDYVELFSLPDRGIASVLDDEEWRKLCNAVRLEWHVF
jgi:hypothetical protein